MSVKIDNFNKTQIKKNIPDIMPGDIIHVHQKIKEYSSKGKGEKEEKERIQIFKGVVIALNHGKNVSGTVTVRRIVSGVGIERVFPLNSPLVEKFEIIKRGKVRRAKLYYLREAKGRKARIKMEEFKEVLIPAEEAKKEENSEIISETQPIAKKE